MRKLFILISLTAILSLSLGIATYAWFTATASSTNNIFTLGTLSIYTNNDMIEPFPLFYTEPQSEDDTKFIEAWYPGLIVDQRHMIIKNDGTLRAEVYGISADITEFKPSERLDARDEFASNLIITAIDGYGGPALFKGTLKDLITRTQELKLNETHIVLAPNGKRTIVFEAEMKEEAGNLIQGAIAKVDIKIHATQVNDKAISELLGKN